MERDFETNHLADFGFKYQALEQYLRDPSHFAFEQYYIDRNCLFTDQIPLISEILNANYGTSGLTAESFRAMVYQMADRFHESNPSSGLKEAQKFFTVTGKAAKGFKKELKA